MRKIWSAVSIVTGSKGRPSLWAAPDSYPIIEWETEPVLMTADEALAPKNDGRKVKRRKQPKH
jgi:hypothetical protein